MTAVELLARLDRVKGRAPHWQACCPAHEDRAPSLSVSESTDRILVKCHAGCSTEAVVEALGLTMADLFVGEPDRPRTWTEAEAVLELQRRGLRQATLNYFRVTVDLRRKAWVFPLGKSKGRKWKAFPGTSDKKYWNDSGNHLSCYHLAPCRGAPEAWLCEGEPDTWIAHQAGLAAFTLTGGAGNINDACVQAIVAAEIGVVHIVYDRDEPGLTGAATVASQLRAVGQKVTVRQLPAEVGAGGDVTTLYNNLGGDDEAFRRAMTGLSDGAETIRTRNAKIRDEALATLADGRQVVSAWGWGDFDRHFGPLIAGWLYVVGARPGCGKTTLLLNLLSRLRDDGIPTLYFGTEMAPADLLKKWAAIRLAFDELTVFENRLRDEDRERLEEEIAQLTATDTMGFSQSARLDLAKIGEEVRWAYEQRQEAHPRVIILDHIHRVAQEREALEALAVELKNLATERRASVIVASQLNRQTGPFELYTPPVLGRFKGSAAIEENADVGLGLFRPLRPGMTMKERRSVEQGERSVLDFAEPNSMGVVCAKHRYSGSAVGRFVSLVVRGSRLESKVFGRDLPANVGDAYEEEQDALPF